MSDDKEGKLIIWIFGGAFIAICAFAYWAWVMA